MSQATLEAVESRSPAVKCSYQDRRALAITEASGKALPNAPADRRVCPMPLPVRSRRAGFDSVEPSADRLGQEARYLSDAGCVKRVTGDFFPRGEVSSRSRDDASVDLGNLRQLADAMRVKVE